MNFSKTSQDLLHSEPKVWERGWQGDPLVSGTRSTVTQRQGRARRRRNSTMARSPGKPRASTCSSPQSNSLTYFTHALLVSKVLAVANGGAAVLRGVTPANLGNGDAVEVADEQEWRKAKLQEEESRPEVNQRGLATSPVISAKSGEVELATELSMRPHQCSAKGKRWTSR